MKSVKSFLFSLIFAAAFQAQAQTATTQAKAAGPTDPEIAHIVVTANQIDVEAGKLAKAKSKNKKVKDFAQTMVTDHTAVNQQAGNLAKKLNLTPKENDTSKSLLSGAKENIDNLKNLKGKEFDKAYVDHEVTYHTAVLDAIDKTLLPNAKNEELKALITKVRPTIAMHLDHAKALQQTLNK